MYPYLAAESFSAAKYLFRVNRGRGCRCRLAIDANQWVDSTMLHRKQAPSGASKSSPFVDEQGWKKYPSVIEFLSTTEWGPDDERKPGTVLLFVDEGRLKGCLTDKDSGMVAFVSLNALSTALVELETILAKDQADWRKSKWQPAKPSGKGRG